MQKTSDPGGEAPFVSLPDPFNGAAEDRRGAYVAGTVCLDMAVDEVDVHGLNMRPFTDDKPLGGTAPDVSMLHALRLLEVRPDRTQREMARELGMSLGKANYVLRALLAKGLVKAQSFQRNANKRGYVYLLTAEGAAAKARLTREFLALKIREYDALRLEIDRLTHESEADTVV